MRPFCPVPPAPEITCYLANEYHARWKAMGLNFKQFLKVIGYSNPAAYIQGMDDHLQGVINDDDALLITAPRKPMNGDLYVMVLLVDFPDLEGLLPKTYYEELLFSRQTYLTGSMADYYHEVSRGKVRIQGEVHGWLRMPHPYGYYTNIYAGLTDVHGCQHYPRDARRLAEEAVDIALANGVIFPAQLDARQDGSVTALFIVHAGRGAEKLHPLLRGKHIWSHKWLLKHPKWVASNLWVTTYLMVPQEALLGVCAHELGHLAFQWDDFYAPNYDDAGDLWDGNGTWDLMAGGLYAGNEMRPVHPAGLHKLQHGWIETETLAASQQNIVLKPVTHPEGKLIKICSPHYRNDRYLLLEYRFRQAFDRALPGEGLLVWRVAPSQQQVKGESLIMSLVQAAGPHHLLEPDDRNNGDPADPFPGANLIQVLGDTGTISTSFPDGPASGIRLKNITQNTSVPEIRLDIDIAAD